MSASSYAKGVVGLVVALFVATGGTRAGTIYVDDNGIADYHTIRAAVDASQSGDTIILAPGTYGGCDNTNIPVNDKAVTIRSRDPNDPAVVAATVIDCSTADVGLSRAFEVITTGSRANLTVAGLTLLNGTNVFEGGAILCQEADLTLINCTISNNRASGRGGAVYCVDSQATLKDCVFRHNTADSLGGGAVSCGNSTLNVASCTFENNTGNAITGRESSLAISHCSFTENTGQDGGAIYNYVSAETLQAYLSLSGCTFVKNSTAASGGALYVYNTPAVITACTFTANSAGADGGAVYNYRSMPMISDSVFIGNAADGSGGAVFNWYQSNPQITNCTFVANTAASGGVMASKMDSNALVSHCILWNNAATLGKNLYLARLDIGQTYFSQATVQYSDVQGGQSSAEIEPGCTLVWGPHNINADPLFTGPFQDDYHLSPDSPCIDAGDPTFIPPADAKDLDGHPRREGAAVDMGAFEYQGLGPVYRFWSGSLGEHFYTISGSERDKLMNQFSQVWRLEGIAYYAYFRKSEANLTPVYRFWSGRLAAHIWTASEDEKNKLLKEQSDTWQYEGVVFYTYPARKQPFGSMPVYRFWSGQLGDHFYTASETEKDKLILHYANTWTYEGVAWYAFAQPYHMAKAAYQFTGGDRAASYTMTLEAYIDGLKAVIDQPLVQFVPQKTQAQMTIDFVNLTTTLDNLHVQTATVQYAATMKQSGVTMPMTLSAQASFDGLSERGPFSIDPDTSSFADFTKAPQNLNGNQETFSCNGTVTMGGRVINFSFAASAVRFELEAAGTFESLSLLPDGLYARMPLTFQWHRPYVKDLLVEASINGHLVQIYVTYLYVGTLDLWEGHIVQ